MKVGKRIVVVVIAVLAFVALEYGLFYLFYYELFHDYKKLISPTPQTEAGTAFSPLSDSSPSVEGYALAAENDMLKLYINEKTGDVAVYDKRSGDTVYSIPKDADTDPIARTDEAKESLKSAFKLHYYDSNRVEFTYSSYKYAVSGTQDGSVSLEKLQDGVRVVYELKPARKASESVPFILTKERFEYFFSQMYDPADETKTPNPNSSYVRNLKYLYEDDGKGNMVMKERYRKGDGAAALKKLVTALENVGYTDEDLVKDMEGSSFTVVPRVSFVVPIEWRLDRDAVVASVVVREIEEYNGQVSSIEFLNNFNAQETGKKGYILMPNGSGSLIHYNDGSKNTANEYNQFIYGIDPLADSYDSVENQLINKLPVFGMHTEGAADVFAEITSGQTLAKLSAKLSNVTSNYNTAFTTFTLRGFEYLSNFGTAGNASTLPVLENKVYDVVLSVRYALMDSNHQEYSGMASYYRDELIARDGLKWLGDTSSTALSDIPFYYDVIGGVKETAFILGTQYLAVNPITTFGQAGTMAEELAGAGITNQVMNFQGWFNGGYYHDVANNIKVISKLGGKKGLTSLSAKVASLGGRFYADVAFQKVTDISKRYNPTYETSRYYAAGYIAQFGQVNPVTLRKTASLGFKETLYYLVSPKFLVRYVDKFASKIKKYDITGIGLRDLGNELHSDKKRTAIINREQALDVVEGELAVLAKTGKLLLIDSPNDYALAYARDIVNAPMTHNDYYIVDTEVPFYQMLIHGTADYTGTAINLSSDLDDNFRTTISLDLIAKGSAPHFTFSYQEANEMKYTGLNHDFSTTFSRWKEDAVAIYNTVNAALKYVEYAYMEYHEVLEEGITKTTYSNGVTILVNETKQAYKAENLAPYSVKVMSGSQVLVELNMEGQ